MRLCVTWAYLLAAFSDVAIGVVVTVYILKYYEHEDVLFTYTLTGDVPRDVESR